MSRLGGWLRGTTKSDSNGKANGTAKAGEAAAAEADKERADLADSLIHARLIMNDDIDGAYAALRKGNSSFHRLAAAVSFFMRSVIGLEQQVMAETLDMLNGCESKAWDDQKAAERRGARGDSIYLPGTEYELVRAESQLMGAVVGMLQESLVEAMKGFYKLRKAYLTLDGIIQRENGVVGETVAVPEPFANGSNGTGGRSTPATTTEGDISESEGVTQPTTANTTPDTKSEEGGENETEKKDARTDNGEKPTSLTQPTSGSGDTEPEALNFTDPVDVFIHSGANMCFGLLMLMLTLVPPSFARILSVVGYRGDRARGVQMLWRSAAHDNINGAVAGMSLLAFYNGMLGTVDILPHPDDYDEAAEAVGPPPEKCRRLLATMRERYPDSRLWQVEEARCLSNERDLPAAVKLLTASTPSKMKQIAALSDFELALDAMYAQDWPLMRDSFVRCAETNDWSPALYYFMAGCASLELYRDARRAGDADEARRQKKTAVGYLRKAPTVAGKKKFMAGKLPFELFLQRKLQRWEERAAQLGIEMADAVGASPALELCYMWNGFKKMGVAELQASAENLSWDRCTCDKAVVDKMKAEGDEMGAWAVCMAAIRRSQGRYEEAKEVLREHAMKHDR
jgi:hypothetical protein